jgi:uncharacterized protein
MNNLNNLEKLIRPYYEAQGPDHDWNHIGRVVRLCHLWGKQLAANLEVLIPAAYLHDIVLVPKNHPDRARSSELAAEKAIKLLKQINYPETYLDKIYKAIVEHSFSRGLKSTTLEASILQDADRIDGIGAIGVLRCASTASKMKSLYYDATDPWATNRELDDKRFMLDHYYTKLLKLPEMMNTEQGRLEAVKRKEFMLVFLQQLKNELL